MFEVCVSFLFCEDMLFGFGITMGLRFGSVLRDLVVCLVYTCAITVVYGLLFGFS